MTDAMNLSLLTGRFLEDSATEDGSHDGHFGVHIEFSDLYAANMFLAAIYVTGFSFSRYLAMPAMVGEILIGVLLGPGLANIVPLPEAFVLLGEIGLILLVLEAGIDVDLTMLRLVGARGVLIAVVGTVLPIALAFVVAQVLGYSGVTAIAAACCFGPTSVGIAMNILRRSHMVNTPVGQLIITAAIIDDMIALVVLSQLRAFAGEGDLSTFDLLLPVTSALGFLLVGGYLAIFVLPNTMERLALGRRQKSDREWTAMIVMFALVLILLPATQAAKASPLMGAFLAGLAFCTSEEVRKAYTSQCKRIMQWLMRIFFAASIGFQVPIQKFASPSVLLEGLAFSLALLGKVAVGFLVPRFGPKQKFLHLRDCLVVGFSMAAEGEFAFVIAVFGVSTNLISGDLYASVVLAVLISTILAPFLLRITISHFNKQLETTVYGTHDEKGSLDGLCTGMVCSTCFDSTDLEEGIRESKVLFWCIQTKSAPAWGLTMDLMHGLSDLHLDVIDHRSWHPRQSQHVLVNEAYVRDTAIAAIELDDKEEEQMVSARKAEIVKVISDTIGQNHAVIRALRWVPHISKDDDSDHLSVEQQIVNATGNALEDSMRGMPWHFSAMFEDEQIAESYVAMEEASGRPKDSSTQEEQLRFRRDISHIDTRSKGRLEGLFRRDRREPPNRMSRTFSSDDGIELTDDIREGR